MKSGGPCEIFGKARPCYDTRHDILNLGLVVSFNIKKKALLNPEKPSFYVPDDE